MNQTFTGYSLILLIFLTIFSFFYRDNQNNTRPSEQKTVIVVGAGISGLRAADILSKAGMKVEVLEARNRIGGRLWSDRSLDGITLDLGASWIHGINDNPLYEYAKKQHILMQEWDYDKVSIFESDGSQSNLSLDNAEATDAIIAKHAILSLISNPNATVQDVIDRAKASGDLSLYTDEQINFFVNTEIELGSAIDASEIPVWELYDTQSVSDEEDPEVIFPQGYDQITTGLAENQSIHLNTKVTKIDYSQKQVIVSTTSGTYEADHVIVTVPLGVLKKQVIEFVPALPPKKQEAIDKLNMGVLNKIYLKFPHQFWDKNSDQFGYISRQKGHFSAWLNLSEASGQPVLMAFTGGSYASKLEGLTNTQITHHAMTVLRTIYGDAIPEPLDVRITRWGRDPYSYGSYSYVTVEASNDMRKDLASSIKQRVFFAGEATSEESSGTVDGAFLSGEREAEKILALQP